MLTENDSLQPSTSNFTRTKNQLRLRTVLTQASFSHPLILMRHGATAWNIADRFQGTTDTVLHQTGKDQALANAQAVKVLIRTGRLQGNQLTIASSPLSRAFQSAKIVARHMGIDPAGIIKLPALREISLGRWEGMNNLKVKEVFYEERQSRKLDRWNFKPQGGESLADRLGEVTQALQSLPSNSVVIAHAGILRIALHAIGGEDPQKAAGAALPHEGLLHFDGHQLHQMFHTA